MKKIVRSDVFALSKEEFIFKLRKLSFCPNLHIDYMDGKLTEKRSPFLFEMDGIKNYPNIDFQLHFMGLYPEIYVEEFKELGIKSILIHHEAYEFSGEIIKAIRKIKDAGIDVGLVLNPSTDISVVDEFVDKLSCVMLMGVKPGSEGQEFDSNVLTKVTKLKEKYPELLVQIDGGVKDSNAKEIAEAGCDCLCVGSAISSQENPEKEYKKLVKLIK